MSWVPPDDPGERPPFDASAVVNPTPSGSSEQREPERRRHRPLLRVAVALIPVIVLIGATVGVLVVASPEDEGAGDERAGQQEGAAADVEVDGDADEVGDEVRELSAFVAEERGLEFREPVEVELLDDDAFRSRLLEDAVEAPEELEVTAQVLRALQLLGDGDDLEEILLSFLGDAVVGFYDPETGELVLRGSEMNPYVRSTLVHELTHALDDQHFELHRPQLEDDGDAASAFTALVEGSATRVEDAWVAQLSAGERRELREAESGLAGSVDLSDVPPVVPQLVGFPYLLGPSFVEALLDDGGQERLDAAFEEPPTTTAQIIDPDRYLAGIEPVEVDAPPAEGDVIDEDVVGAWFLRLMLQDELGPGRAAAASGGWAGDRYVAWEEGGEVCMRAAFVGMTRSETAAMEAALQRWADDHGDAEVAGEDRVVLTACG